MRLSPVLKPLLANSFCFGGPVVSFFFPMQLPAFSSSKAPILMGERSFWDLEKKPRGPNRKKKKRQSSILNLIPGNFVWAVYKGDIYLFGEPPLGGGFF